MTQSQKKLTTAFANLNLKLNEPLAPKTYFKIGGPAEVFWEANQEDDLLAILDFCRQENIQVTVLGGGSNVIVDDKGVVGLVVHPKFNHFTPTETKVDDPQEPGQDRFVVKAGSGLKTALLVSKTTTLGLTGLEYFLGVPGTVGGAIYNNSHYLDDLIGEYLHRVKIVNERNNLEWLRREDCRFGYDYSRFQETQEIIIEVEFALPKGDKRESAKKIKKATEYRARTQPLGPPSSGCIFQNVPNSSRLRKLFPDFKDKAHVPGGYIIDQAGLKGTRVGGVHVSQKHAAWFINDGHATSEDVKKLIEKIKHVVKERFGIDLQEEVFYLQ